MTAVDHGRATLRAHGSLTCPDEAVPDAVVCAHDIDFAAMDCLETNLAALLRLARFKAIHGTLGAHWHFEYSESRGGEVKLEREPVADQIEMISGVEFTRPTLSTPIENGVLDVVARHGATLFFGDAFAMPWLPLYEKEHLEHTFVVTAANPKSGLVCVLDTYTNLSEHGRAVPVITTVDVRTAGLAITALARDARARTALAIRSVADRPRPAFTELCAVNAAEMVQSLARDDALRGFARYFRCEASRRNSVDGFVLACWLTARKRQLHHLWLLSGRKDGALSIGSLIEDFDSTVVEPWKRAAEFAYLLERRIRAGRQPSTAVFDFLEQTIHPAECGLAERFVRHLEGERGNT